LTALPIGAAEAYAFHKPYFTKAPELYQSQTRQRIARGATVTAAAYIEARRELDRLRRTVGSSFSSVDLLITPTSPRLQMTIEEGAIPDVPPPGVPSLALRNTQPFDIFGLPTISIPCGFTRDGMPIGLQIAGPRFGESHVLALAHAYQQVTDWHTRRPPV
jgi:aspartyl-tRNA(Asn)/glutamyl-tRNA(Gln) amidotransferase subunit A